MKETTLRGRSNRARRGFGEEEPKIKAARRFPCRDWTGVGGRGGGGQLGGLRPGRWGAAWSGGRMGLERRLASESCHGVSASRLRWLSREQAQRESKPETLIVLFRPVGSQRPRLQLLLVTEGPSPTRGTMAPRLDLTAGIKWVHLLRERNQKPNSENLGCHCAFWATMEAYRGGWGGHCSFMRSCRSPDRPRQQGPCPGDSELAEPGNASLPLGIWLALGKKGGLSESGGTHILVRSVQERVDEAGNECIGAWSPAVLSVPGYTPP